MAHRQGSSSAAEINGAEDDVKALRKQLTRLTLERDELQRDVENLCMQGSGNSIFDSSSVLSERIYSTEQELSRAKAQLAGLVSERDGLREDLHSQREAKRMSDQGWKSERQKVQNLEKELAFYQSQSTRAIQDRDKAVYEAEELKALSREQQRRLLVAETTAEQESTLRAEMQEELEEATQRVKDLEGCEQEAAAIPGLRQDLRAATARVDHLQQQVKSLQDELHESQAETATAWQKLGSLSERAAATEKELKDAQAAASEAEAASSKQIQQLKATVDALQQEQENLEGQLRDAHRKLAEANTELRTVRQEFKNQMEEQQAQFRAVEEETYNEREQQVLLFQKKQDEMQSRISAVEKQLQEVSQDKVKALLRLSELERVQAHDGSELDALRRQKSDLQVRLAQATQEKVNVLMQLAEAKGQAGDPKLPSSIVSPKQQASGSWRIWRGSAPPSPSGSLVAKHSLQEGSLSEAASDAGADGTESAASHTDK